MNISVFLSYPKPFLKKQQEFVDYATKYLLSRGLEPRTMGVSDYDMDSPLSGIRRLMLECNGLLTIAFRRTIIEKGTIRPNADIDVSKSELELSNLWITSPFCQIEPSMAFQIGLPILLFKEEGVIADGVLEYGVTGTYLPEFDLSNDIPSYFETEIWKQLIRKWEYQVRTVASNKGKPPQLY